MEDQTRLLRKLIDIFVCDFMSAGWTQQLSVFPTTCSSRRRTPCNSFNSILLQCVPNWPLAKSLTLIYATAANYHVAPCFPAYWVRKCVNVTKQWYRLCLWGHLDFADLMYDIVADCSDNVPTRYLVNDACVLSGKPLVSASALRMEGQVRWKSCITAPTYF